MTGTGTPTHWLQHGVVGTQTKQKTTISPALFLTLPYHGWCMNTVNKPLYTIFASCFLLLNTRSYCLKEPFPAWGLCREAAPGGAARPSAVPGRTQPGQRLRSAGSRAGGAPGGCVGRCCHLPPERGPGAGLAWAGPEAALGGRCDRGGRDGPARGGARPGISGGGEAAQRLR